VRPAARWRERRTRRQRSVGAYPSNWCVTSTAGNAARQIPVAALPPPPCSPSHQSDKSPRHHHTPRASPPANRPGRRLAAGPRPHRAHRLPHRLALVPRNSTATRMRFRTDAFVARLRLPRPCSPRISTPAYGRRELTWQRKSLHEPANSRNEVLEPLSTPSVCHHRNEIALIHREELHAWGSVQRG
jgi:hypothetical protein